MQAQVIRQCGDQLEVKFRGRFAKVIPFRYKAKLTVVHQQQGLTVIAGSRRIGPGGSFQYYGQLTDSCFTGTYSSRRYQGGWSMSKTY